MTVQPTILRRLSGAVAHEVRQSGEVARIDAEMPRLLVVQHVLAELRMQHRQPLRDGAHPCPCLRPQPGAAAQVAAMHPLQQPHLVGLQPECRAAGMQRVDPREQTGIERDPHAVLRQQRRHLAVDRLQLGAAQAQHQVGEHRPHPPQRAAAALQRLDGIGEVGRLGAVGDRGDLRQVRPHRRRERGHELLRPDQVERRRLERRGPGSEQDVGRGVGERHARTRTDVSTPVKLTRGRPTRLRRSARPRHAARDDRGPAHQPRLRRPRPGSGPSGMSGAAAGGVGRAGRAGVRAAAPPRRGRGDVGAAGARPFAGICPAHPVDPARDRGRRASRSRHRDEPRQRGGCTPGLRRGLRRGRRGDGRHRRRRLRRHPPARPPCRAGAGDGVLPVRQRRRRGVSCPRSLGPAPDRDRRFRRPSRQRHPGDRTVRP